VGAAVTTRQGGASQHRYSAFNLAAHVGDSRQAVSANRAQLQQQLALPLPPQWLEQVHGVKVIDAAADGLVRTADGATTQTPGLPCAVLTADCLPILLCDEGGTQVAALHAGWRSLAAGIVPQALQRFSAPSSQLMAWLGPAISARHFEVGVDVLEAFFNSAQDVDHSDAIAAAVRPGSRPMHFYADLYQLARAALAARGVTAVYGGDYCTYRDASQFYSYRRDGAATGRMASLIWLR
jgi:YfiH family protein